jgi:hypothetical protein
VKLNVFGKLVEIIRENDQWILYSLGEGKKRRENDFAIPPDLSESEVVTYMADIFHEFATPQNSDVKILD